MTSERMRLIALWIIALMLVLDAVHDLFTVDPAEAVNGEVMGRYQISSWAAHTGGYSEFNGYYILDTVTGKVVEERVGSFSSLDGEAAVPFKREENRRDPWDEERNRPGS